MELAMLRSFASAPIEILEFRRFDKFRDIFLGSENAEFAACMEDLKQYGFSVDLNEQGLGPGKLLVRGEQAGGTIEALKAYCLKKGKQLLPSHVVVSQEYKTIVEEVVAKQGTRNNRIVSRTSLHSAHFFNASDSETVEQWTACKYCGEIVAICEECGAELCIEHTKGYPYRRPCCPLHC